jgi:hypothetical protein
LLEALMADVPDELRAAALAAFRQRSQDAIVADIVFDSLLDDAGVADQARRLLRFAVRDTIAVEIDVLAADDTLDVTLRLSPARVALVHVTRPQGSEDVSARTDETGTVALTGVHAGIVSFVVDRAPDSTCPALQTAWVRL